MKKRFKCPASWSVAQRISAYTERDAKTGCLNFTGTIGSHGYGVLTIRGVTETTHRLAWTTANGPIPEGGHILHSCDNRRCCNPDHLRLGTNADNVADMLAKGRQSKGRIRSEILPKGERHGMSKLTDDQARAIFRAEGNQSEIARAFGVRNTTVSMIKSKQTWRHIHD